MKMYYQIINASSAEIGLVWRFAENKPIIENIFLPCPHDQLILKMNNKYFSTDLVNRNIYKGIDEQLILIYSGAKIDFNHSLLNYEKLTKFSALVLKQVCNVPPGNVDTYSGLAAEIGSPGAARAVGSALAANPFPLVIPCHRIVRANGSLGGFGGGIRMKSELLMREGVILDYQGRVPKEYFYVGC
jgi:methylated-DNA-[protein]-cysteine S-methyltransferase